MRIDNGKIIRIKEPRRKENISDKDGLVIFFMYYSMLKTIDIRCRIKVKFCAQKAVLTAILEIIGFKGRAPGITFDDSSIAYWLDVALASCWLVQSLKGFESDRVLLRRWHSQFQTGHSRPRRVTSPICDGGHLGHALSWDQMTGRLGRQPLFWPKSGDIFWPTKFDRQSTVIWHGDLGTTYGKKYGKLQLKNHFNKSQHGIGFLSIRRDFHWVQEHFEFSLYLMK